MECRAWGVACGVWGLGLRSLGLESGVKGSRLAVQELFLEDVYIWVVVKIMVPFSVP